MAFLNPGIQITFRDERLETPKELVLKFEGGINEYTKFLNEGKKVVPEEPIYVNGEQNDIILDLSMQFNDGYEETLFSYVNDINTREGGTHLDGFKNSLTVVLNDFLQNNEKLFKKLNPKYNPKAEKTDKKKDVVLIKLKSEDILSGLTAVVSVKVPEPQFEGQTKQKLGNTEVKTVVYAIVKEKLTLFFEQNPQICNLILEKSVNEALLRLKKKKMEETSRKDGMDSFGLPGKLADCSSKHPEECEADLDQRSRRGAGTQSQPDYGKELPDWCRFLPRPSRLGGRPT